MGLLSYKCYFNISANPLLSASSGWSGWSLADGSTFAWNFFFKPLEPTPPHSADDVMFSDRYRVFNQSVWGRINTRPHKRKKWPTTDGEERQEQKKKQMRSTLSRPSSGGAVPGVLHKVGKSMPYRSFPFSWPGGSIKFGYLNGSVLGRSLLM